jgi:hypothetical protein
LITGDGEVTGIEIALRSYTIKERQSHRAGKKTIALRYVGLTPPLKQVHWSDESPLYALLSGTYPIGMTPLFCRENQINK